MPSVSLVFIHGYSVTSFETYGQLPLRLKKEATQRGLSLSVNDVFLTRYISFRDEIDLSDLARALEHAVATSLNPDQPYVFISHSTGGPLVRLWWKMFYQDLDRNCPMTHFIMLAPANHGSALAQLGKSKLSRLKNFLEGIEPGQGVLNWLELGSAASIELNTSWIKTGKKYISSAGVFPFVITGQSIDRKMYDHINSYTGETGSDGVIRAASANLNSSYIKLIQKGEQLVLDETYNAAPSAFKIVNYKSHSGDKMGIMRSIGADTKHAEELVDDIFSCMAVSQKSEYDKLVDRFHQQTRINQEKMRVETEEQVFGTKHYVHDICSQVIVIIKDDCGHPVNDFDLVFTGENDEPDLLPEGFLKDRQVNTVNRNVLSFYFNFDRMYGCEAVTLADNTVVRKAQKGLTRFGIKLLPRPNEGFVRYAPCAISGTIDLLKQVIQQNSTTIVEIVLSRLLSNQSLNIEAIKEDKMPKMEFKNVKPGNTFIP